MSIELVDRMKSELLRLPGKHYVVLATTANNNNPSFYAGGIRYGGNVAAANFLFTEDKMLAEVIRCFDGCIDAFLIDTEVKNSFSCLESEATKLIRHTPVVHIKPNDMTVTALDLWLTLLTPSLSGINVLIVGAGNIGSKISMMLAERGAIVKILDPDVEKVNRIVSGLSAIIRGNGYVSPEDPHSPTEDLNIILGCTPGVPAITPMMIQQTRSDGILIDVGNGTIFPEAVENARQRGIRVFCLSPEAGFLGWIYAYYHAEEQVRHMKRRILPNGSIVIGPGVFGDYGDVLVDNPDNWQRIIGVCNGQGDVLPADESKVFIQNLKVVCNAPE